MDCLRIERLTNGYLIRVDDPKIAAANAKDDRKGPWRDPERKFVFDDVAGVMAWLKANIDKALPEDDYATAFDNAVLEEEDDE